MLQLTVPSQIPKLPVFELQAQWWPIYFEPLAGSGERFTAMIAVQPSTSTAPEIRTTLRMDVLKALYGGKAVGVVGVLELVQQSLGAHLKANATLANWSAPMTGFSVGAARWSRGNSVGEMLDQAVMMGASLGTIESVTSADTDSELVSEAWTREIRQAVPLPLLENFNRKVSLGATGWQIRLGFLSSTYAAQFGVLRPQRNRVSHDQLVLKARMMDLAQLKGDLFPYADNREIIVGHPNFDDRSLSGTQRYRLRNRLGFLEKEADAVGIRLRHTHSSQEAAQWIAAKQAA